jgi:hypothetical protein
MMEKILTMYQAKTIHKAIRELRNIGASFNELELNNRIRFFVYEGDAGYAVGINGQTKEHYDTLTQFADAYGFDPFPPLR